jgi:FdhD protein
MTETTRELQVTRVTNGSVEVVSDRVAEETPISLTYHGVPQVVMMATPDNLEDLAVGFTVTESFARADEIRSVQVTPLAVGAQVDITIAGERFSELLRRQRNLTGRTGCGVCGVETIDQAIRTPSPVKAAVRLSPSQIQSSLKSLAERQTLNSVVGSVHAAAWATVESGVSVVREDVGRHNALDKVIGSLLRNQLDPATGYLLITSRASYEMVLKAAMVGVSVLIAVSAPTGLAIELANQSGITLVGFARDQRFVAYTHAERLNV